MTTDYILTHAVGCDDSTWLRAINTLRLAKANISGEARVDELATRSSGGEWNENLTLANGSLITTFIHMVVMTIWGANIRADIFRDLLCFSYYIFTLCSFVTKDLATIKFMLTMHE